MNKSKEDFKKNDNVSFSLIPQEILKIPNSEMKQSKKLVLSIIWSLSMKKNYCWASNAYIGKCTGLAKKTVANNISELISEEYIERIYRDGDRLLRAKIERNGAKIIPLTFQEKIVQSKNNFPKQGGKTP